MCAEELDGNRHKIIKTNGLALLALVWEAHGPPSGQTRVVDAPKRLREGAAVELKAAS
jgi:hypothetical protein